MIRALSLGTTVLLAFWGAAVAQAQPIVDRVLDSVQKALDNPNQPIPIHDNAGNPLAEPTDVAPDTNEPGYLGVIADDRQEGGHGVRLLEVVAGSPAEQCGLKKDDLITSIADLPIRSMDEMAKTLSAFKAGEELKFIVLRGQAAATVRVKLGQRPGAGERRLPTFGKQPEVSAEDGTLPPPQERPKLGVRTLPVTEQAQRQFNLPNRDGAIIVAVTPGSAAERAGLRLGAVITALNGEAVHGPEHLAELVAASPGDFDLTYIADGRVAHTRATFGNGAASQVVARPAMPDTAPGDLTLRLEAVERRLQELEDRIQKLEEASGNPLNEK